MIPLERIAAVAVTYNNSAMLGALLKDLAGQTRRPDEIIVIDNSTTPEVRDMLKAGPVRVRYIKMPGNTGSAGGYAEGIRLACERNDAVWLLDDDVSAAPDALEQLIEGMIRLRQAERVGAVRSWSSDTCPFTGTRRMGTFCWRGTMITREAVQEIGLPRSDFFLYGEDHEYSLRLQRSGYTSFWVASSRVIEQRHGDKKCLSFLGVKAVVYRDPAKLYYAFRNSARIYILYRMWAHLVRLSLFALKVFVLAVLTGETEKGRLANAMASGIRDGCSGNLGVCASWPIKG